MIEICDRLENFFIARQHSQQLWIYSQFVSNLRFQIFNAQKLLCNNKFVINDREYQNKIEQDILKYLIKGEHTVYITRMNENYTFAFVIVIM